MCLKIKTVMVLFSYFMCLFFQIKKKSVHTLSDVHPNESREKKKLHLELWSHLLG